MLYDRLLLDMENGVSDVIKLKFVMTIFEVGGLSYERNLQWLSGR